MDLNALYQDLSGRLDNNTLELKKNSDLDPAILRVLDVLPNGQLKLTACNLALDKTATPPRLSFGGSLTESWPIPSPGQLHLDPEAIEFVLTGNEPEIRTVTGSLTGHTAIGDTAVPVTGSLTADDTWLLSLGKESGTKLTLGHIAQWAGGSDALASLTKAQSAALVPLPATLNDLSVELGCGADTHAIVSLKVGVSGQLALLDKLPALKIEAFTFSAICYGAKPAADSSVFSFGIHGQLELGSRSYDVAARNLGGIGQAVLEFVPATAADLPSLTDLAGIVGGKQLSGVFRQTMQALGLESFAINSVELDFDSKTGVPNSFAIFGTTRIANASANLFFRVPEFRLSGQLSEGPLELAGLVTRYLPGVSGIPSINVDDLSIAANLRAKSVSLYAEISDNYPIDLGFAKLDVGDLSLNLDHTAGGKSSRTAAMLAGTLTFAGIEVSLTGEIDDTLTLIGTIPRVNLSRLLGQLAKELKLPESLPDIDFEDLAMSITPSTGAFSLNGGASGDWQFPAGAGGLSVAQTRIRVERKDGKQPVACTIELEGAGPGSVVDGLSLDDFKLNFERGDDDGWAVSGSLAAALFKSQLQLEASYAESKTGRELTFSWSQKPALPLLNIGNLAALTLADLSLSLTKDETGEGKTKTSFGLAGDGRIAIGKSLFDSDVSLGISAGDEGNTLLFVASDPKPIRVTLGPIAGQTPVFELDISNLRVEADTGKDSWALATDAHARLSDLPAVVEDFFPQELPHGRFGVSDQGISFDCPLPKPLSLKSQTFALKVQGQEVLPIVSIPEIGVLLGENPVLRSTLHVTVPEGLNYFLGTNPETNKPKYVFLNPAFEMSLTVGRTLTLALANGTSPFKELKFKDDGDGPYFMADFGGGFNTFRISVPQLEYSGESWTGSAGITVVDPPLRIPLVPVKYLLRQLQVPSAIISNIPDAIPIDVVDFKTHKNFRSVLQSVLRKPALDALYAQGSPARPVLQAFDEVWRKIATAMAAMPEDFQTYATPPNIKTLKLNLGCSPVGAGGGGGWSGGIETNGDPVSFMLPMLGFMPPELVGFSLKTLEFGWAASGGYGTFKIDGNIDRFDIVTLAIAIESIASETGSGLLPKKDVRQLTNHLELDNVSGIFFPGFPVPIPLLYDKMAWSYKNWWGLGGHGQVEFHFDPGTTMWTVLEALVPFIIDPEFTYKLHEHPDEGPHLTLRIGPNNLQLPDYLSGKMLGSATGGPNIPVDYSIRYLLDACKFTNPGYGVQAIPLKDPTNQEWIRLGSKEISFGPLSFNAGWCVTTEEEFRAKIVGNADAEKILGQLEPDKTLARIPKTKTDAAYDKGFIVLLTAGFGVGAPKLNLLSYQTQFGMAVTSTGGFETGFYMAGAVGPLELFIEGTIEYSRNGETTIAGSSGLTIGNTPLIEFKGHVNVTDRSFELAVDLIFGDQCTLGGTFYIGVDKLYIEGHLVWGYAAGKNIAPKDGFSAQIDKNGLLLALPSQTLFGSECDIGLYVNESGIGARAAMNDLSAFNKAFGASLESYQGQIDKTVQDAKKLADKAVENLHSFEDIRKTLPGFLATLRTKTIPGMINSYVHTAYENLSGVQKAFVSEATIRKEANKYFSDNYAPRIRTLETKLSAITGPDKAANDKATRDLLMAAVNEVLNIKNVKYTYTFTVKYVVGSKKFSKTVTIPDPVGSYRTKLESLKSLIGMLPSDWSNKSDYEAKAIIKKNIDDVVENIEKQVPTVQAIELDVPIRFENPTVNANVKVQYAGKVHALKTIHIDLVHPLNSIGSITESFANALSG